MVMEDLERKLLKHCSGSFIYSVLSYLILVYHAHLWKVKGKFMNNNPLLSVADVRSYIENYLKQLFVEPIAIVTNNGKYLLNNAISFPIYDFWNKNDRDLLNDFEDFSFKGDYIGTIFFFLSGYWEYTHNDIKDRYGRFPSTESFSCKKGILEEPVVDILVERIREELGFTYKDNKPKAFVTHDVDHLWLPKGFAVIRSLAGDIIVRRDPKLALDRIKRKIAGNDPWSVYNLIDLHKKNGTRGTFFFLAEKQPGLFSNGYNVIENEGYLRDLAKAISSIDGKIGLHYDIRHLDENRMKKDVDRLSYVFNRKIEFGRAHYLLFDVARSFDIYEKAGIKFDSTCSFSDAIGFRFGTSKPFRPYNFREKREYNLIEIPLIVMEGTLRYSECTKKSPEIGFEKIKQLTERVKRYNGTFTFLWHNSSSYVTEWRDWEWVYNEAILYLKKSDFEFI